jgi:hypothetical protein
MEGRRDRAKLRISKLREKQLLTLAVAGFLAYWLFLILAWPPLAGFLSRIIKASL